MTVKTKNGITSVCHSPKISPKTNAQSANGYVSGRKMLYTKMLGMTTRLIMLSGRSHSTDLCFQKHCIVPYTQRNLCLRKFFTVWGVSV